MKPEEKLTKEFKTWFENHELPKRERIRRKAIRSDLIVKSVGDVPKSEVRSEQAFQKFCKEKGYEYGYHRDKYTVYRKLTEEEKEEMIEDD